MSGLPFYPEVSRHGRRLFGGLISILAAAGLAACGGSVSHSAGSDSAARTTASRPASGTAHLLDVRKVASAVERSIYQQRGLRGSAQCPERVTQSRGNTFTCTVKVGARRYPVIVTQVDSRGDVQYVVR